MGTKSRDWESIGKIVSQIKEEGLTHVEGAKRYGIPLEDIREYRRRFKDESEPRSIGKVKNWEELGEYVERIRDLGLNYAEGAEKFGLDVKEIYRYNYNKQIKEKERRLHRCPIVLRRFASKVRQPPSPNQLKRLFVRANHPAPNSISVLAYLQELRS